jgi:hypothetical protein
MGRDQYPSKFCTYSQMFLWHVILQSGYHYWCSTTAALPLLMQKLYTKCMSAYS